MFVVMARLLSFKPTEFYFRRAIRDAKTKREAQIVGYALVDEYERLRSWLLDNGVPPPEWRVLKAELRDRAKDRRAQTAKASALQPTPALPPGPPRAVGG